MSDKNEYLERAHHPVGPSTLQAVEACPVYQGRQPKVQHERTVAGSIAHESTENREDDQRLSDDDAAAVAECLDFFDRRKQLMEEARYRAVCKLADELLKEHKFEISEQVQEHIMDLAQSMVPPVQELNELKVKLDEMPLELPVYDPKTDKWSIQKEPCTTSGYFDKAIISHTGKEAEMFDWKFGMWPVEDAKNNVQGICYSISFLLEHVGVDQVTMYFKQPHLNYVTNATFTRADIPHLRLRVMVIVDRARHYRSLAAKGDWSGAVAYDPICTFCVHIGHCPKVAEFCIDVARKYWPPEVPEDITPTKLLDPKNSGMGLRVARIAASWASAFKTMQTDRVLRKEIPEPEGHKLQTRAGRREIIDMVKFKEIALKYLTEAELAALQRYVLGDVEGLIHEKAPRGQKKHVVVEFQDLLEANKCTERGDPITFLRSAASREEKTKSSN